MQGADILLRRAYPLMACRVHTSPHLSSIKAQDAIIASLKAEVHYPAVIIPEKSIKAKEQRHGSGKNWYMHRAMATVCKPNAYLYGHMHMHKDTKTRTSIVYWLFTAQANALEMRHLLHMHLEANVIKRLPMHAVQQRRERSSTGMERGSTHLLIRAYA